jgi:hypothetical protein
MSVDVEMRQLPSSRWSQWIDQRHNQFLVLGGCMLVSHLATKTEIPPLESVPSVFVNLKKVKEITKSKAAGITCDIIHMSSDIFVTMHLSSLRTTAARVLGSLFLGDSEGAANGEQGLAGDLGEALVTGVRDWSFWGVAVGGGIDDFVWDEEGGRREKVEEDGRGARVGVDEREESLSVDGSAFFFFWFTLIKSKSDSEYVSNMIQKRKLTSVIIKHKYWPHLIASSDSTGSQRGQSSSNSRSDLKW